VERDSITVKEIWRLGLRETRSIDYLSQRRIVKLMNRRKEWEYGRHYRGKRLIRGWKRIKNVANTNKLAESG
jgi:hypothetical protein